MGEPAGRLPRRGPPTAGGAGAMAEQLEGEAGGVTGGEGSREGMGQLGSGRGDMD